MPIYEYECNDCGCHFEKRQSFHDEPVAICPECEGKARRVLHAVPIIFKGSGFYVTDYPKSSTAASSGSSSGSSASNSTSSDSKKTPPAETKGKGKDK